MPRTNSQNLEPFALGRYAFWQGRPISTNPLIGQAAREWTIGWRRGLTELVALVPPDQQQAVQALPAAEQRRLVRLHCPSDIPPAIDRPQGGSGLGRGERDALHMTAATGSRPSAPR